MFDRREWLETNGLGGFASSTVAGVNTRRYHGLLVAATRPPVGRMVLLSKLEETLVIGGRRYDLSANRYPGVIHPQGFQYLKEFRQDPFPVAVYELAGLQLEKSVFMVHGQNTTVVSYSLSGEPAESCTLELRPLIAFRDYHATTHENGALNGRFEIDNDSVRVMPYEGLPALYLSHLGAQVHPGGDWYRNFEYEVERERGLDDREDLFNPCVLIFDLRGDRRADVIASTQKQPASSAATLRTSEIARRESVLARAPSSAPMVRMLAKAADQFIVARGEQKTVIAGYHWFSDWGRDTMIALPGLTLATGGFEAAKSILLGFASYVDRGMLPNRFPDAGESPEYNTVDATLWYFEAIRSVIAQTGDHDFVRVHLYDVLRDIIAWHERGTRYGIRLDSDGLLNAGEPGIQLTWMDAKIGDWVVTPRGGKPVEIQALWYNALRIMEDLAGRYGDSAVANHYRELADQARSSFAALFWNAGEGCLYDVVKDGVGDPAIRPNQMFAVSLFHKMLSPAQMKSVVAAVERHLFTPYGLRSLAPSDPQYRRRFEGDPRSRDSAYHQGTAWPWLLGPFITAYVAVHEGSTAAREQAADWLGVFRRHMEQEGLGQIPEVFDGDAPQRPGGCIAQAWSVAELLRAAVEDVYVTVPAKVRRARVKAAG